METKKVVRTKMASAMIDALHQTVQRGDNPGKVGGMIVRHEHQGTGIIYRPRKDKERQAA